MDFQARLLKVGNDLRKDEVRALVFLCSDILGCNPAAVQSAGDLFSRLSDQDHLSEEQPHLLVELLGIIQRTKLLRDHNLPRTGAQDLISPYRKLLYSLSEELTADDLKDIKFLLNNKLPRGKLEEVTTLEVFMELEHRALISDTDLGFLESIIQPVCPVLLEKINQFNAQNSMNHGLVAQETGRPIAETDPQQSTEVRSFNLPPSQCCSVQHACCVSHFNQMPSFNRCVSAGRCVGHLSPRKPDLLRSGDVRDRQRRCSKYENPNPEVLVLSAVGCPDVSVQGVETYLMTAAKRGRCLIINNCNFRVSRLKKREGTMVDEASLDKVLKWLGFEVEIQRDCTSKKMSSLIQELAKTSQRDWDCVMCCVLSHGLEGGVYGVDGGTVEIRKLMEPFSGTNCPSLAGKPKIFFIQACQGSRQQDIVYTDAGTPGHGYVDNNAVQAKECIPSHADFLLGMATVPSFVSFRDGTHGTWYIQSLCQNLADMVPRGCDLISILTKVNADVSKKVAWIDSGHKTQMPQPAFTLTKKIVFPAPNTPHPVL
uniref:Caspase-8 n=1 Tax=Takifugu rubripes TaxID=31033 RepID=H2V635_TAKRU